MKKLFSVLVLAVAALAAAAIPAAAIAFPATAIAPLVASDGTPVVTSDGIQVQTETQFEWDGKSPNLDPSCQGFGC